MDNPGWFKAQVQVPSMDFARMLLFGLGAEAQVLEPETLRVAMREGAALIVKAMGG